MKGRTLVGMLVVGAVAIVCVPFAPTNLGGHTTYVTTHGTSMVPRFHAGDLAIVQPASAYRVGDIAAYHSATLHGATVLHRIVAIEAGRFTFKGDNNNFFDPDRPTADQLVGRLRVRIPHGGAIRSLLARPIVLFPLLALAIGGAGSGLLKTKKRRRNARWSRTRARAPALAPDAEPEPVPRVHLRPRRRRLGVVIPLAATLAVSGCLIAAVAIWHMPRTETTTRHEPYGQHLTVGYSSVTRAGAAYPDGLVRTGDPIFTQLVKRVDINLGYDFRAAANAHRVEGTYDVIAVIASGNGWHRSLSLARARPFSGDRLHATATLDLGTIRSLETRFTEETGLDASQAVVSIAPHVRVTGNIAGAPISADIASKLDFQLSPVEMILKSAAVGTDATQATKDGSVTITTVRAHALSLWKVDVSAELARLLSLIAAALVIGTAAAITSLDRRRITRGEVTAIIGRYGRLLIATRSLPPTDERTMIRVDSMRALARLANLHEELIIHASASGRHRFALFTDTAVYVYEATPAPARQRNGRPTLASA
jgi:signal peptidase I